MANQSAGRVVVLIVEDEPLVRLLAVDIVEAAGFEAVEAANADGAIRILETRSNIQIVFTDVEMPGSIDGLKLAAAVRGRWPPIEIIVTSGKAAFNPEELPERAAFIPKPYAPHQVVAILRRFAA